MPSPKKSLSTAEYRALLVQLPVKCPSLVINIAGQNVTVADLAALLESLLAAEVAVPIAKAQYLAAIKAAAALEATAGVTVKDARGVVALMFKSAPAALAELAIPSRAPRAPLSTEARLRATAKLRATRKARGTKSKKQRLAIKGAVVGVSIVPVVRPPPEEGVTAEGPPTATAAR
jgi:hypothetical protein